jgi:hypothetical protein
VQVLVLQENAVPHRVVFNLDVVIKPMMTMKMIMTMMKMMLTTTTT